MCYCSHASVPKTDLPPIPRGYDVIVSFVSTKSRPSPKSKRDMIVLRFLWNCGMIWVGVEHKDKYNNSISRWTWVMVWVLLFSCYCCFCVCGVPVLLCFVLHCFICAPCFIVYCFRCSCFLVYCVSSFSVSCYAFMFLVVTFPLFDYFPVWKQDTKRRKTVKQELPYPGKPETQIIPHVHMEWVLLFLLFKQIQTTPKSKGKQ